MGIMVFRMSRLRQLNVKNHVGLPIAYQSLNHCKLSQSPVSLHAQTPGSFRRCLKYMYI